MGVEPTVWVAIAGIVGTLVGTVTAPVISERIRRRSARDEYLLSQRVQAYADILELAGHFAERVSRRAAGQVVPPLSPEETRRVNGTSNRARVVVSNVVRDRLTEYIAIVQATDHELELMERRGEKPTPTDSALDLHARVREPLLALENAIRREMGSDR